MVSRSEVAEALLDRLQYLLLAVVPVYTAAANALSTADQQPPVDRQAGTLKPLNSRTPCRKKNGQGDVQVGHFPMTDLLPLWLTLGSPKRQNGLVVKLPSTLNILACRHLRSRWFSVS